MLVEKAFQETEIANLVEEETARPVTAVIGATIIS